MDRGQFDAGRRIEFLAAAQQRADVNLVNIGQLIERLVPRHVGIGGQPVLQLQRGHVEELVLVEVGEFLVAAAHALAVAGHVVVDGLRCRAVDGPSLAQAFPAVDGQADPLGNGPPSVALKQEPCPLQLVCHGRQHVVGLRHYQPPALRHVQLAHAVDAVYAALLGARFVDLLVPPLDTRCDALGHHVDGRRDAIGLLQDFRAAGQVDEVINVGPSPAVDGLVVIARAIHPVGDIVERMGNVPLHGR